MLSRSPEKQTDAEEQDAPHFELITSKESMKWINSGVALIIKPGAEKSKKYGR